MLSKTSYWLSACLHYSEPWEELIGKAVKPFADVVLQTGIADKFYFSRSLDLGPNLRLNFKGSPDIFENILKPNLEEHFQQYFATKPSVLIEPMYPEGLPHSFRWHPNNSIRYISHEPMLHRYGGQIGWEISERAFSAASIMANHLIREKASQWNYTEMLGTAMKLHLGLAYASGLNLLETSHFFRLLFKDWESKQTLRKGLISSEPSYSLHIAFKRIKQAQQIDMASYVSAMWELFRNIKHVESPEFIKWFDDMTATSLELELALELGKLKPLQGLFSEKDILDDCRHCEQWSYLAEYIYLTNNNLGIHKQHEGYLLYLLDQSLRKIAVPFGSQWRIAV